jgi:hypothetical protein
MTLIFDAKEVLIQQIRYGFALLNKAFVIADDKAYAWCMIMVFCIKRLRQ